MNEKLEALITPIKEAHEACLASVQTGVKKAQEAGKLLLKAKALCQHGEFGDWIDKNCPFSQRTANVYMSLSKAGANVKEESVKAALQAMTKRTRKAPATTSRDTIVVKKISMTDEELVNLIVGYGITDVEKFKECLMKLFGKDLFARK